MVKPRLLPVLLVAAASVPVAATPRPLTAEERLGLACASAFALVAAGQARGDVGMMSYPPLAERGREYFVRLSAQLMDDAGLDQAGLRAAVEREAAALRQHGVSDIMPVCLVSLDRELPPGR
jgi:hypothetical protein